MSGAERRGTLSLMLGSLTALGPLSIDMYLPSFQAIARDLSASPAQVQLTLAVFFVALGIGQAFYGPVSDRFGGGARSASVSGSTCSPRPAAPPPAPSKPSWPGASPRRSGDARAW